MYKKNYLIQKINESKKPLFIYADSYINYIKDNYDKNEVTVSNKIYDVLDYLDEDILIFGNMSTIPFDVFKILSKNNKKINLVVPNQSLILLNIKDITSNSEKVIDYISLLTLSKNLVNRYDSYFFVSNSLLNNFPYYKANYVRKENNLLEYYMINLDNIPYIDAIMEPIDDDKGINELLNIYNEKLYESESKYINTNNITELETYEDIVNKILNFEDNEIELKMYNIAKFINNCLSRDKYDKTYFENLAKLNLSYVKPHNLYINQNMIINIVNKTANYKISKIEKNNMMTIKLNKPLE